MNGCGDRVVGGGQSRGDDDVDVVYPVEKGGVRWASRGRLLIPVLILSHDQFVWRSSRSQSTCIFILFFKVFRNLVFFKLIFWWSELRFLRTSPTFQKPFGIPIFIIFGTCIYLIIYSLLLSIRGLLLLGFFDLFSFAGSVFETT